MNNDAAILRAIARIHEEYRSEMQNTVRSMSPDDLASAEALFQAEEMMPANLRYKNLPDDVWPALPVVRPAIRKEITRRSQETAT